MRSFAYDLALERLVAAGRDWLDTFARHGRADGRPVDEAMRAFRRVERRDRRRAKKHPKP